MDLPSPRPGPLPPGWLSLPGLLSLLVGMGLLVTADRHHPIHPDLFWHLNAGRDMVAAGTLTPPDHSSFLDPGAAWWNPTWLFDLGLYGAVQGMGWNGLRLVRGLCLGGTLLLLGSLVGAPRRLTGLLALGLPFLIPAFRLRVDPSLASLVSLAGLLWLLERRDHRHRWWLPLLFAGWANLDPGALAGLVVLGGRLAGERLQATRPSFLPGLLLLAASLAATFCTPAPGRLWWDPLESLRLSGPSPGLSPAFLAAAGVGLAGLWAFRRRQRPGETLVFLLLAGLAPWFPACLLAFSVGTVPYLSRNLGWGVEAARSRGGDLFHSRSGLAALQAVLLTFALVQIGRFTSPKYPLAPSSLRFPVEAVGALPPETGPIRILHPIHWGGYLAWTLPGAEIFVDGRRRLRFPSQALQEAESLSQGGAGGEAVVRRHRPQVVLVPTGHPLGATLAGPHWTRLHADAIATLFLRRTDEAAP